MGSASPCGVGDKDENVTYAAVGLALTNWGHLEHQLGEIFLALIGGNSRSYEAMMAFGSIMSGRGRSDMIEAAAKVYFATRTQPKDITTKKRLVDLMEAVNKFADRRNEIAHGVVMPAIGDELDDETDDFDISFVLTPSFFTAKKRRVESIGKGHFAMPPSYEYSSKEIRTLATRFEALVNPAATIAREIRRQRHLERQISSQKSLGPAEDP